MSAKPLILSPDMATTPAVSSAALARRLLSQHVRPYALKVAGGMALMGVAAASTAALAALMKPVIDEVFVNRNHTMLLAVTVAVIAASFVKGVAMYGQTVTLNRVGQRIIADLQTRMFAQLMRADLQFFHDNPTGQLISRLTNDVNLMRGTVTQVFTSIGLDAMSVAFLVVVMFWNDWTLGLIAFVAFPLAILPIVRIGRRMRKVSANTQVEMGNLAALLEETFQGARHVKAYGMEDYETGRARAIVGRITGLVNKAVRVRALSNPIMELLGAIAIAGVILYGGNAVITGTTTAGDFFSFMTALLLAYRPVKSLANLNATLQEGLAAAARVFSIIDLAPDIRERDNARALAPTGGEIRFEAVGFAYKENEPVLRALSLACPKGRIAALVGPSGGGKSTIINLIPRFYDVGTGRVSIDGVDVRDATLASLRAQIAIVSQDISLFHDTVRANIAYGRPGASEAEIAEAARVAGADEFIAALPEGYDTMVGERGTKLSGGQRQRIAIARALLKNAPILLLDEATSALDNETERQVQAALKTLMQGRTTLVVAHRLSTIADADIIYVVEGGRVVEQGRHAELLARGGAYARLYAAQAQTGATPADEPPARVRA
jgi:subfamily B ATP-binding cassette protein MsbA